jgi:hypothetical protein
MFLLEHYNFSFNMIILYYRKGSTRANVQHQGLPCSWVTVGGAKCDTKRNIKWINMYKSTNICNKYLNIFLYTLSLSYELCLNILGVPQVYYQVKCTVLCVINWYVYIIKYKLYIPAKTTFPMNVYIH